MAHAVVTLIRQVVGSDEPVPHERHRNTFSREPGVELSDHSIEGVSKLIINFDHEAFSHGSGPKHDVLDQIRAKFMEGKILIVERGRKS